MQYLYLLVVMSILTLPVSAQLFDDFSDGEIASNPVWSGDLSDFVVNGNNTLQLNAPTSGTSVLWTRVMFPDSLRWQFYYQMDFAPSSSNRMSVYLMTDTTELSLASGYMLQIGENGSDDALHFFSVENGIPFLLGSTDGIFGSDPSEGIIVIERINSGSWSISNIVSGNTVQLLSISDQTTHPSETHYFGLQCTYSETRKDKFFFDDIQIEVIIPDISAPVLEEVVTVSSNSLQLVFNEPLSPASISAANISVNQGIGTALAANLTPGQSHLVDVELAADMQNGITYEVLVVDFSDLHGNIATEQEISFTYTEIAVPGPFDIVINELMPDPSPAIGLPNAEFIELFNPTDRAFDLEGIMLHVGSSTIDLPGALLNPGAYMILSDTEDADDFSPFGEVLPIALPTLTNTGTTVELLGKNGNLLHGISYDLTWYRNSSKDDGGWSLEMINPDEPCALEANWRASESLAGGTPGAANSVLDRSTQDSSGPELIALFPDQASQSVVLTFNELLGNGTPEITLTPAAGGVMFLQSGRSMTLFFDMALETSVLYTLSIGGVTDCIGNASPVTERNFGLPSLPEVNDLIINEILFDPQTGGHRFLELYNTSSKFLSTAELNIIETDGNLADVTPIEANFLIFPQSYVVLTNDPADLATRYPTHDLAVIVATGVPSFDRKAGVVGITDKMGNMIDQFDYSDDLHNPLLDNTKGVSLERVSISAQTNDSGNWHSAAQGIGFATPGLPNSQAVMGGTSRNIYTVINATFSPDGDGFKDFLLVQFENPLPGTIATIRVFNALGREVNQILKNELIGRESLAQWDGTTSENLKAPMGIYVLLIEVFDASGYKDVYKEVVVLAARL